jgi:hypothetical protein
MVPFNAFESGKDLDPHRSILTNTSQQPAKQQRLAAAGSRGVWDLPAFWQ